jgi:hypothetical protein
MALAIGMNQISSTIDTICLTFRKVNGFFHFPVIVKGYRDKRLTSRGARSIVSP